MSKYKVGDKVRIISKRGDGWNSLGKQYHWCGKVMTIRRNNVFLDFGYYMEEDREENFGDGWLWGDEDFVGLAFPDNITITHDGKTTTATMEHDGKTVKATARCNPEDEFDFTIGAKIAFERLMEMVEYKPTYYNGKVVCIRSGYPWWTVGKVYEVKDGVITSNDGDHYPKKSRGYRTMEEVRHAGCDGVRDFNYANEFIPFIEE